MSKILIFLALGGLAFYGYRRYQQHVAATQKPEVTGEIQMKKCEVCGLHVAQGETKNCGRGDCPLPKF